MQPILTKTFDFCTVECFNNYVIVVMNQGITVKPEHNEVLAEMARMYFEGRPFGYITHRKNSYAVDPSVYRETSKIKNLVAFAVVSQKKITAQTVKVEKMFLEKPFQLFPEIEEAVAWVESEIEKTQ